jgi:hypothetical protein
LPLSAGEPGVKGFGHGVIFIAAYAIEITPRPGGCQTPREPGPGSVPGRRPQRPCQACPCRRQTAAPRVASWRHASLVTKP